MGPRLFTAEEVIFHSIADRAAAASMGPRLFTAEEPACVWPRASCSKRFNGAAVVHRGRALVGVKGRGDERASMGPRLFTAEELDDVAHPTGDVFASMGPRLFTAEEQVRSWQLGGLLCASMGPRLFTAEEVG